MDILDTDLQKTDVLKMALQLIKILEKLHDTGLVHLDIKPDNILIGDVSDLLQSLDDDPDEEEE